MIIQVYGGLCNRLRVIFSYLCVLDNFIIIWESDQECNGYYLDYFEQIPNITFQNKLLDGQSLDIITNQVYLKMEYDVFSGIMSEKMILLSHVKQEVSNRIYGDYTAVHVRRTDINVIVTKNKSFIPNSSFIEFINQHDLPVYLATDNYDTQKQFISVFDQKMFCKKIIPNNDLRQTPLIDAIIDMFVCVNAKYFMGTKSSSLSEIIHSLRKPNLSNKIILPKYEPETKKISAIMVIAHNHNNFLNESINSIINFVDEIVIVTDFDVDKDFNNEKINHITINEKILHHELFNIAIEYAQNEWIFKWDPCYVACQNFGELLKLVNTRVDHQSFFFKAPMLHGNRNLINPNQPEIIHNLFLAKRSVFNYQYCDNYGIKLKFNDLSQLCILQSNFYFVSLSNCDSDDNILYYSYNSNYWMWLKENKESFKYFFEKILCKNYESSIIWINKNKNNGLVKHNLTINY
jgi:hypothetical protein